MKVTDLVTLALQSLQEHYLDEDFGGFYDVPRICDYSPWFRKKKLFYNAVCAIGLSCYPEWRPLCLNVINYLRELSHRHGGLVPAWEGETETTLGEQGLLLWALARGYGLFPSNELRAECERTVARIESQISSYGVPHFPETEYYVPMSIAFCLDSLLEYGGAFPSRMPERAIRCLVGALMDVCRPPVFMIRSGKKLLPTLTFNNIAYAVHALSRYASRFDDFAVRALISDVIERFLTLQGRFGEWWWQYSSRGTAVGKYPIYSVHQHGMAIMALEAVRPHVSRELTASIDDAEKRSFDWLHGRNEVARCMIDDENLLIYRSLTYRVVDPEEPWVLWTLQKNHLPGAVRLDNHDPIQRYLNHRLVLRGVGRIVRALSKLLSPFGLHTMLTQINPVCRSYELGWLLYAAHLLRQDTAGDREAQVWCT